MFKQEVMLEGFRVQCLKAIVRVLRRILGYLSLQRLFSIVTLCNIESGVPRMLSTSNRIPTAISDSLVDLEFVAQINRSPLERILELILSPNDEELEMPEVTDLLPGSRMVPIGD